MPGALDLSGEDDVPRGAQEDSHRGNRQDPIAGAPRRIGLSNEPEAGPGDGLYPNMYPTTHSAMQPLIA